jgi:hypothetical protein
MHALIWKRIEWIEVFWQQYTQVTIFGEQRGGPEKRKKVGWGGEPRAV